MGYEVVLGDLGDGGNVGLRVARPGFDVFAEPFGSKNIAFDSRLQELSTVIAQGLCQLNQPIGFNALPYVPVAMFNRVSPFQIEEYWSKQIGTANHQFIPYIGVVTSFSFIVVPFQIPFYGTGVGGATFAYTVFGIQP